MPVPFIVPLVGWGATALGGAASAYSLSQMPKQMRKDIIREGPDVDSGEFELNTIQDLFVDKDSLMDSYNKRQMNLTKKDARVQQALSLDPSFQVLNGQTAEDFLNQNRTGIKKAQNAETVAETQLINQTNFDSPGQVRERQRQDQARTDQLTEARAARADVDRRYLHQTNSDNARRAHEASEGKLNRRHQSELADQSNNMQIQMSIMSNDLQEKRMAYDRETRRMDKRSAAIAQLMSGLGSLGGAFAL